MNIGILSRGPLLYSTQSLWEAGQRRGHFVYIIDHTQCQLVLENEQHKVYYEGKPLSHIHAVIPRIGVSVTNQGAAVIRQFELMGVFTSTLSNALLQSRDKLFCLQRLSQNAIPVPRTMFLNQSECLQTMVETIGGFPVVIKLLESTHGVGVLLAENLTQASSILEMLLRLGQRVVVQEFIAEAEGADIRAFVVGGEVVAVMRRQAAQGEFRSNLHRGASATPDKLTEEEIQIVLKTVATMGLDVAGVDLLRSSRGALVMEVNASPGLEGIETVTGIDIATKIIKLIERKAKEK